MLHKYCFVINVLFIIIVCVDGGMKVKGQPLEAGVLPFLWVLETKLGCGLLLQALLPTQPSQPPCEYFYYLASLSTARLVATFYCLGGDR